MSFRAVFAVLILTGLAVAQAIAQTGTLTVQADQPSHPISPMLYGLMTEEINHSYDGGIYAELIQNRAFKDNDLRPVHWSLIQAPGVKSPIALDSTTPLSDALQVALRLTIPASTDGHRVGIANDGYWGIPVQPNTRYRGSFYAKANPGFSGPLTAGIESNDGSTVFASATIPAITGRWKKYEFNLTTGNVSPTAAARFVISASAPGTIYFDLVSLFPPTFNDRPNGNRIDIMQTLGDMHPAFLRLPGGNYLEGNTLDDQFPWATSLHGLETRPGHRCPWGYRSSDGLGLLEYLNWCEDLHMEPLLAVFAGYALRGQHIDPGPGLQPLVIDALNEIEYCTGDASTYWGHQRALDGHPAPFIIHYIEIGNEDWFDRSGSYDGRFAQFFDAIKAQYPSLQLIATTPVKSRVPDLLDDHFYRSARAMEHDATHYDKILRGGPKIFVGEWASRQGSPTPNYDAALGDAAWLTGLERNSDLVVMSSYAPLLVNVNPGASQWSTNLVGYDALSCFASPSYYVQQMFSQNRGDTVLPVRISVPSALSAPPPTPAGGIGVATWETNAEYKDLKVTHGDTVLYQSDPHAPYAGLQPHGGSWTTVDGVLRQTSDHQDVRATAGDPAWTDYAYTLKARKISGNEGFMIMFHCLDNDTFVWWNVGGWNNTRTALEKTHDFAKEQFGPPSDVSVETGRWYDVRIELSGRNISCYLDGKLITQATDDPGPAPAPLFATASRVDTTGEVILKVVNILPDAQKLQISLQGLTQVAPAATEWVLSGQPLDQNSIGEPRKIVPKQGTISGTGAQFMHEFPAYSVTVMRLPAK